MTSPPCACPIDVAALAESEVIAAASLLQWTPSHGAFRTVQAEAGLHEWLAMPEHHLLGLRVNRELAGLVLCHADGEDFIADGFLLDGRCASADAENAILHALVNFAAASGCGAVVLRFDHGAGDVQALYRSVGLTVETLESGEQELAFAWQACDALLDQCERLKRYLLPWDGGAAA